MKTPRSTYLKFPIRLASFALVILSLMVSLPAMAAEGSTLQVLGSDGTVTKLVEGPFGDLFPGDGESGTEPGSQVLALEQTGPEGEVTRWLVPGTEEGSVVEKPAGLVLDDGSGAIFLLWETAINGLHPLLRLVRFDGEIFSASVDITSGAFADKGTAQLVITREVGATPGSRVEDEGSEEGLEERILVVHVVWWQHSPGGSFKLYTPVFIENGQLSQRSPILDLSQFSPATDGEVVENEVEAALEDLLGIREGDTSQTVVLGFLEPTSGLLRTLRVDVVPTALSDLGDKIGAEIVIIGMRSNSRQEMAEAVWPLVLDLAKDHHESIKLYMAARLEELILTSEEELTPEGLEILARHLSHEVLTMTTEVGAGGLAQSSSEMIEAVPQVEESPRHVLMVRVLSERAMPTVGTPAGTVRFFLSSSGFHAMVAWEEEGRVMFRETTDAGWGETGSVEATEILSISAIYRMLEQRIASR